MKQVLNINNPSENRGSEKKISCIIHTANDYFRFNPRQSGSTTPIYNGYAKCALTAGEGSCRTHTPNEEYFLFLLREIGIHGRVLKGNLNRCDF